MAARILAAFSFASNSGAIETFRRADRMSGSDTNFISVDKIAYALGRSSLGWVLVARSVAGICAILIGDDPKKLVDQLRDHFGGSPLGEDETGLRDALRAVVALAEEPWRGLGLPLDIKGTAFQRRVWRAVSEIPPGETVSYAEIARRIGEPKALRAVAGACAANILALAIPCHRVLRRNGSLSGYRWGLARKRALLAHEARALAPATK
jgi:AraC family transcriptional regulator of adaptative response/methylated-DNA-[protein]-cysteine methyltransferase